jgi:DNA-binding MarR family transcriptional regulator
MADSLWLSDAEQAAWRASLEMWRLLMAQLALELHEQGLSHADYEVLVRLSETPGRRVRMSDLSAMTLLSRSRLSHQVRRMEEAGLVRREECPTDRRGAYTVLTDHGWDTIRAVAPDHVRAVRRHLFDHLTDEQVRQLTEIAARVVDHLRRTEVASHYQPLWQRGDEPLPCADLDR